MISRTRNMRGWMIEYFPDQYRSASAEKHPEIAPFVPNLLFLQQPKST